MTLRELVRASLDDMPWLTASDAAMRALALRLAAEIDRTQERAETYRQVRAADPLYHLPRALAAYLDATRTVAELGPKLHAVLRDLGGTPGARRALDIGKEDDDLKGEWG